VPDPISTAAQQAAASSREPPLAGGDEAEASAPFSPSDAATVSPRGSTARRPNVDETNFGEYYFRHDCGEPYERSEHWLEFFDGIADHVVRELRPLSVLDAGCAIGMLVEAFQRRGVDAEGLDISAWAIEQAPPDVREHLRVASLTEPLPRRYDLITCIEVVEHMSPADGRAAVDTMCAATDRILLSSSPVDYGEPTHLNVQSPEHWSALLAGHGFVRNLDYDASYITPWAALYERSTAPVPEVVRSYDRAWWRLRSEVDELRSRVLAMQSQLESTSAGDATDDDADERAALEQAKELRHERAQLREQILRLRDLVVGGESELGVARGRVAELEALVQHYVGVEARLNDVVQSHSWRVMWFAGLPVRKLRSRRGRR
jgi:SAM-dependent methyltransferase